MQTAIEKIPPICKYGNIEREGEKTADISSPGNIRYVCENKNVVGNKDKLLLFELDLNNYSLPALVLLSIRKNSDRCKTCEYHRCARLL